MRSFRPCLFLAVLSLTLAAASAHPQTKPSIDETHLVTLPGTVHPLAQPKYDRGQVDPSFPTGRLLLTLARPADREQSLQQFLKDVHDPDVHNPDVRSPNAPAFHQWLTPTLPPQKASPGPLSHS